VTGSLQLFVPAEPAAADRLAILTALAAFNRAHADPAVVDRLATLLKDDDRATVGGLWGATGFGRLQIELLLVPGSGPGAAFGKELAQKARALAVVPGAASARHSIPAASRF
jgi:hypothetical protein